MTAAPAPEARVKDALARIGQGLSICQLCEEWFPRELLSAIEHCCARCLAGVGEQNTQSRRELGRRVLRAELRKLPGIAAGDMDLIIETAEAAYS